MATTMQAYYASRSPPFALMKGVLHMFLSCLLTNGASVAGLRMNKAHVTHPELKTTFNLEIIGVK